ncbi:MAG: phosphoglycerate dehydrogenase [Acidaminobacteraceae bacterium]
MKILLTYDYGDENRKLIENLGYEVLYIHESEILNNDLTNDCNILICYNPFGKLDISKMPKLKLIVLSSIGFDQLPFEKLEDRNILVTNNQGGYSIPMGEWIVMNILEIFKKSKKRYNMQNAKKWKIDTSILEIYNKKILFLGTGTIAKEGAKRLVGFSSEIYGANRSGKTSEYFDKVYKLIDIYDHLDEFDIVISTLPHTHETEHAINAEFLKNMKYKSALINVSRGKIIDELALINCLSNDKLLGVALDVFNEEPLSETSPLWDYENVYISSHNSWISEMRNERRFNYIINNLRLLKEGKKLKNEVNIKRGY